MDLPSIVWKGLVGEQATLDDLRAIDVLSWTTLNHVKGPDGETYAESFTATSASACPRSNLESFYRDASAWLSSMRIGGFCSSMEPRGSSPCGSLVTASAVSVSVSTGGARVELVPGGADIPVTAVRAPFLLLEALDRLALVLRPGLVV